MSQRDRIDPASREPLEGLLQAIPGGFNAIEDIDARRETVANMLSATAAPVPDTVTVEDRTVPGADGDPDVAVRIYRPANATGDLPGIFFIHGGGMVIGSIGGEEPTALRLCQEVGAVVVSTDYRKAPEAVHPAQMNDCYAAFEWFAANTADLGVDADRVAVYGGSAGGNLAIAVALAARDRKGPKISYLMPVYPMVDDRNETPSTHEVTEVGIWDRPANIEAWGLFLGGKPADGYAAPARADDLSGLPPTFIDVGEVDMFRDEDFAFAQRLIHAGVPTEFHVYPGVYHGSETFAADAPVSQKIWHNRIATLRNALGVD